MSVVDADVVGGDLVSSDSQTRVIGAVLALLLAGQGGRDPNPWVGDAGAYARAELLAACRDHGAGLLITALDALGREWVQEDQLATRRECGLSLLGLLAAAEPEPDPRPGRDAVGADEGWTAALEPGQPDPDRPVSADHAEPPQLTTTQMQIVQLVADGRSNLTIAARLGRTEDSIKTHLQGAMRRLGARDRAHTVLLACQHGLLTTGDPR